MAEVDEMYDACHTACVDQYERNGKLDRVTSRAAVDAVPDGWAKVDGEWVQITSDGVGYGEFDREVQG